MQRSKIPKRQIFKHKKSQKLYLFLCIHYFINFKFMVEPLLSGIVLGLVPVTLVGLFVTAYLQYRRGDRITNF